MAVDKETVKTSILWYLIYVIMFFGFLTGLVVFYALAWSTYETGMRIIVKTEEFMANPISTIHRLLRWNHKSMRISKVKTEQAKSQTSQTAKNLLALQTSMETHVDIITRQVASLTIGKRLRSIQETDSSEISKSMKSLAKEGRFTGSLFSSGAKDSAILTGKINELYPKNGESDQEFRVRLINEITSFRRKVNQFRELISNGTLQIKIFRDKTYDFKVLLGKKKLKYVSIHQAAATEKSILRRISEIGGAFCAGATAGAGTGLYLAWNPLVAVVVAGATSAVTGTIGATYAYFDSKSKSETADESYVTMFQIEGMSHCVDGMEIYLGKAETGLRGVDSEISGILFDIENLEVSNGQTRFVKLIAKAFKVINDEYDNTILKNNVALDALKPLSIAST